MKRPGASRQGSTEEERRDRAQMVLITALLLATVLVGLAVILNSAIYAENQATRRSGVGGSEAVQFQSQMQQDTGAALEAVNRNDYGSDADQYSDYESRYESSIGDWERTVARSEARRGIAVSVAFESSPYNRGTRVVQDGPSEFQPADTALVSSLLSLIAYNHWQVTEDTRVRNMEMTFDRNEFDQTVAKADAEAYIGDLLEVEIDLDVYEPPFATAFDADDDGAPEYAYTVYKSGSDEVSISIYDGVSETTCTTDDPNPTLDLAAGTFGGEECEALSVFSKSNLEGASGQYDIYFVRGDNAHGTYEFVTDKEMSTLRSDVDAENDVVLSLDSGEKPFLAHHQNSASTPDTTDPRTEQAIYSAEMDMAMESGKLEYSRENIRIAPGDLDEDDE